MGAGVDVTFVGFRTERDVYLGDAIGQIAGSATGIGVTGRFGMHMESPYVDGTKFGLNFRTPMNINLEGNFDLPRRKSSESFYQPIKVQAAVIRCRGMSRWYVIDMDGREADLVG